MEIKTRRSLILFLAFGMTVFMFGANCTLGRLFVDHLDMERTQTSFAIDTEWSYTYTAQAKLYNAKTAAMEQATWDALDLTYTAVNLTKDAKSVSQTQTKLAPKPPVITSINFPAEIPGNKSTMIGLLYFKDLDGDISHVIYSVINATQFVGGTDFEPQLNAGTWNDGSIKIYIWCDGEQDVTLQAVLLDQVGNKSNPMNFSFTCKVSDGN